MSRKSGTVRVGNIRVTPITAKEHRRLEKRIKRRHQKLRSRYREIHGRLWIGSTTASKKAAVR